MKKIKIVQIESFYPQVIYDFYKIYDGVKNVSFEKQIRNLIFTGFSGGHNVVPYMNGAIWEAHYIILNNLDGQIRWAKDNGLNNGISEREIIVAQLQKIAPDIIYLSDIPGFDFTILDELRKKPKLIGWHATIVSERTPWHLFDLVLSGINHIREEVIKRGAKSAENFMPAAPNHSNFGVDTGFEKCIVFSGSFYGGIHNQRAEQFRQLSRLIPEIGINIHTSQPFGLEEGDSINFKPAVYGNEVINLYSKHKIVLDSRGNFNLSENGGPRETSNMRIFEATRSGSLLITEDSPNLKDYFIVGKEIETYKNFNELVEKIKFYSDPINELKRREIADAGLARTRRDHLIEHRASWFENILEKHFHGKIFSVNDINPLISQKGKEAYLLITSKRSIYFAINQMEQLYKCDPNLNLIILDIDDSIKDLTYNIGSNVTILNKYFLSQRGLAAENFNGENLKIIFELMNVLFNEQQDLVKITWLGQDVFVNSSIKLDLKSNEIAISKFDLNGHVNHAFESLGLFSSHCFSCTRDGFYRINNFSKDISNLNFENLVNCIEELKIDILPILISTPWSELSGLNCAALSYVGPLALIDKKNWQLVNYDCAPNWQSYFLSIYLPLMQRIQQLFEINYNDNSNENYEIQTSSIKWSEYFKNYQKFYKNGYRLLSKDEYQQFELQLSGWDNYTVAAIQHASFRHLLEEFKANRKRADLSALFNIIKQISDGNPKVLEAGCGSGYNSELLELAISDDYLYTGIDIAQSMIDLANKEYPSRKFAVMRSEDLDFAEDQFDIVLNGASLMHTINYENSLKQARRVASKYVVLHTITVSRLEENVHFEKNAYGSRVPEVCFSEKKLNQMLKENNLLPIKIIDSIEYNLNEHIGVESKSVSVACYCLPQQNKVSNTYCTYFDANYLPRGVAMIRSLLRFDPSATIWVLCFDDICYDALSHLDIKQIQLISIEDFLASDQQFARSKENRTQIEWYFTATSCLVNYLLLKNKNLSKIVYLDADLYFYASPEFLLEEASNASVQIIEHRFSEAWKNLTIYGKFNVGWISFSNSIEGRKLISEYREDCIKWCYDRLEDDKFGDQKYLDKWPEIYPKCCVSKIKGANVAWWNLQSLSPRKFGENIYVDNDILIFYHFQEIKKNISGLYVIGRDDKSYYGDYLQLVYEPYLAELNLVEVELNSYIKSFKIKDIRYKSW